jgi:hypothetical protein
LHQASERVQFKDRHFLETISMRGEPAGLSRRDKPGCSEREKGTFCFARSGNDHRMEKPRRMPRGQKYLLKLAARFARMAPPARPCAQALLFGISTFKHGKNLCRRLEVRLRVADSLCKDVLGV